MADPIHLKTAIDTDGIKDRTVLVDVSVLQATESWVGPGNEAICLTPYIVKIYSSTLSPYFWKSSCTLSFEYS